MCIQVRRIGNPRSNPEIVRYLAENVIDTLKYLMLQLARQSSNFPSVKIFRNILEKLELTSDSFGNELGRTRRRSLLSV